MSIQTIPTIEVKSLPPIVAEPLTPEGFAPFGGVISSRYQLRTMAHNSANYGTATKLFQVSPIVNNYELAESRAPAKANFNLFRCSPPEHLISRESAHFTYKSTVLERHPFSTQTFLPLGRDKSQIAYLVIVALKKDGKFHPTLQLRGAEQHGSGQSPAAGGRTGEDDSASGCRALPGPVAPLLGVA